MKKILKGIFPIVFLKRMFLYYNIIRIKTIDKLVFPEYKVKDDAFDVKKKHCPFDKVEIKKTHLDVDVRHYVDKWDGWTDLEYLLVFRKPCTIEPEYGWALVEGNRLNYYSLGLSRTLHQPKPSLLRLFSKKEVIELDSAISLRDTGEENYFHFYNDVLSKLFFLRQYHSLKQIPVIISKKLYDKPFFQFFLQHSSLKQYNWVVQDKQYIKLKRAYFCKPITHHEGYLNQIVDLIPPRLFSETSQDRRVFLIRSPKRLRFIENLQELVIVCGTYNFEIVDADKLTVEEQIQIFANTRYLVAIHGAGLTNMLFRRNRTMSILEIFPPAVDGYLPFHYMLMANMFSFSYDAIIGDIGRQKLSGGFYVHPVKFAHKLSQLCPDGTLHG